MSETNSTPAPANSMDNGIPDGQTLDEYYDIYYGINSSTDYICDNSTAPLPDGYELCVHILLPIFCAIGMVGIILTVIVLSRKNMSTSTNCYLISLAIADLCFLIAMTLKVFEFKLTPEQHYNYAVVITYIQLFHSVFILASGWLTVMLAIERYIAICHPLRAMSLCTVVRARIFISLIFFLSFLFEFPAFFKFKLTFFKDPCIGKEVPWLELSAFGQCELFRSIHTWGDCILTAILPFQALLLLNGCLIREIRRSTNYLRYHLASDSNVRTIITSEEIKITVMLISVVFVFFVCQAPFVILHIFKRLNQDKMFEHFHILTNITILLLILRSSLNFILYCWFSEKFWNTFKRTLCMPSCIFSRYPTWIQNMILENNSEHGNSNNNRKISYFNTREEIC